MVVAIGVAYALSGSWAVALAVGLIEPAVQTVAFFFHERAWHRWGGVGASARGSRDDPHNAVIDSVSPAPDTAERAVHKGQERGG